MRLRKKIIKQEVGFAIRGEAQLSVVDARTKEVIRKYPVQKNLILNRFMEGVPARSFASMFTFAVASTGVTPTADDSGATVAVQATTTVTLSGGSFTFTNTATDAGKIIKWDTGEESRIVTVTDPTHATVTPSQTVASGQFTVYRTNQSQMSNTANEERAGQGVAGTSYLTGAGNCETLYAPAPQVTMTRTYDFAVRADGNRGASGTPYAEIGMSELTTVGGSNLNSRILLNTPVPVENGQQLRVKYSLIITLSPTTPESIVSSPITGWATASGKQQIQRPMLHFVASTGLTTPYVGAGSTSPLEPFNLTGSSNPVVVSVCTSSAVQNAYNTDGPDRSGSYLGTQTVQPTLSTPAPTYAASTSANALFMDKIATFNASSANGTWRTLVLGYQETPSPRGGLTPPAQGFVYVMDNDQLKDSLHSLQLNFRFTWSRTLS